MNAVLSKIFGHIRSFLVSPAAHSLILIIILAAAAVSEFLYLNLARRTFVFYNLSKDKIIVEDRMLKHAESREDDLIRYAEETLLGPASPDLLPLFPKGTKLLSLLLRDGVVYANLSPDAVMPPVEGGVTVENFRTFYDSILRNFSYVDDVRFFIGGIAVYSEEFHKISGTAGFS